MSASHGTPAHPLIGINGLLDPGDTPRLNLPVRYADSVLKAGGVPVAIPPVGGPADLARLVDRIDGLLLSGGDDFDTERLGLGPTHPSATKTPAAKQDFDLELARLAIERGLPVLGICYGMQCLALASGAGLHQHLPDLPGRPDHSGRRAGAEAASRTVRVAPGTKLARVLGVEELEVVCRHHQALAGPGAGWDVAARSSEDLIEAIERSDATFAVGVQWHPELSGEGSPNDRLFRGLVGAACLRAARRAPSPVQRPALT
jgi:gamma-glutamyl-gamma-aminobutyrate hydrolase PuuD